MGFFISGRICRKCGLAISKPGLLLGVQDIISEMQNSKEEMAESSEMMSQWLTQIVWCVISINVGFHVVLS